MKTILVGVGLSPIAFVLGLAFLLSGCGLTPQGDALRAAVRETGETIADTELGNLEWALCNGVSVGAIKRRYGGKPKKAAAWQGICAAQPGATIFSAEGSPP